MLLDNKKAPENWGFKNASLCQKKIDLKYEFLYFSVDSNDSGYDEYDEEYSHIITESSSPELVQKVERDFRPVDLPELLVITGRACTRILSGYQKNKAEEAKILSSLREEGLLAKPKIKTTGGMSFEVVDATLLENKTNSDFQNDIISNNSTTNLKNRPTTANGDAFVTAEFIPSKTLKKLELRRTVNILKFSSTLLK